MKKALSIILSSVLVFSTLTGCSGGGTPASSSAPSSSSAVASAPVSSAPAAPASSTAVKPAADRTYVLVGKDQSNPYMKKTYDGFEKACKELGVKSVFKGPASATPEAQIEVINQLIAQKVDLIAVAANDFDALQPVLTKAMSQGIVVMSEDSAVNPASRITHINQADPEKIGRGLIQAAYKMENGKGGIAILSATAQASNQNLWISWMQKELKDNPDKYKDTPLIKIVYGDDDPTKSTNETQALLKDPKINVIIAPTTVGMLSAGKYLQDNKSKVLLTGLGLPSEMAPFIEDGTCPWMYLWNPIDIGYLAAYTGDSLVNKKITGAKGDNFKAGTLGEKVITEAADGGTEVMLGEPFKFDKTNIAEWKNVY